MTARQIDEWVMFYRLEPWGFRELWRRAATVACVIINVFRGKGKSPTGVDKLVPDYDPAERVVQTVDEQKRALVSIFSWFEKRGRGKRRKRE